MKDEIDKAYELFQHSSKSQASLEVALQILLKTEAELIYLDTSLHRRMYWGLMAVEMELSCHPRLSTDVKIAHINKAQQYVIALEKIVIQSSSDASIIAQVSLQQHIIGGRKAVLDFEVQKDVDQLTRLKSEAMCGIDVSLATLREVDLKIYGKVFKDTMEWRDKFDSYGSYG